LRKHRKAGVGSLNNKLTKNKIMANEIDLFKDLNEVEKTIKETNQPAEMNDLEIEKDRIIQEIKKNYPDLKL